MRTGDPQAMQAIFDAHAQAVARTVRGLACSAVGVEDLVQEVFVIAFVRIETYDDRVPIGAWLRGIAVNVVRGQRRRETRRDRLRSRFDPAARERPDTPEEALATRRLGDRFWDAVNGLPQKQREAFVLRVLEQQSLSECGAALGLSVKAVSRRALAAERRVRAALDQGESS